MSEQYHHYQYYHQLQKTRLWRFVAITIIILACCLFSFAFFKKSFSQKPYIAHISIDGMIIDAEEQAQEIQKLKANKNVKAVIVAINSPGGTTYDSEILYNALVRVSKKKPIVTYMKNVAASGGYIVALAGEKIFAARNTITGSIGVLMQSPNAKKLLDNVGISFQQIKSSPIKGEPNYFSNTPPEAIENLQSMIDDTHNWFKNLVKQRRPHIKPKDFPALTNGSVFTGQQAINNKLVDSLGGKMTAKKYLISKHKLDKKIKIKHITLDKDEPKTIMDHFFDKIFGFLPQSLRKILPSNRNNVDGMLSLWHS